MPDQIPYSIEEDQAPQQDLSTLLGQPQSAPQNIPQVGGSSPQLQDLLDRFQQESLNKYLTTTPEGIKKKKKEEYYKDLGVSGTGVKSKLFQFLKEFNLQKQAKENEQPYVPLNERLSQSADAEYKTQIPELKETAKSIYQNIRGESANKNKVDVQTLKNDPAMEKIKSQERIANIRNDILRNSSNAKNGDIFAQTRIRNSEADAKELVNQKFPGLSALPKSAQDLVFPEQLRDILGDEAYQQLLATRQLTGQATQKPSDTNAYRATLNPLSGEAWDKAAEEATKRKIRINASRPAIETQRPIQSEEIDPATGLLTKRFKDYGTKTGWKNGEANPVEEKKFTRQDAFTQTLGAVNGALGTVQNAIKSGKSDWQGLFQGNAATSFARALGYNGNKQAEEALSDIDSTNVSNMHAMATRGGGRVSNQAAEEIKKTVGGKIDSPESRLFALLAHKYSAERGLLLNAGSLKQSDITPQLMAATLNKMAEVVKSTMSTRGAALNAPSLLDIKKGLDIAIPSNNVKRLSNKYGLE